MTMYHKPSGLVKAMNSLVGRLASWGLIPGGTALLRAVTQNGSVTSRPPAAKRSSNTERATQYVSRNYRSSSALPSSRRT